MIYIGKIDLYKSLNLNHILPSISNIIIIESLLIFNSLLKTSKKKLSLLAAVKKSPVKSGHFT